MKRGREVDSITMANCLMLLSRGSDQYEATYSSTTLNNRVFECKTCNRQFPSFQALGGHRASHKKPKLMGENIDGQLLHTPLKPKIHECSICGLEFAIGQALGGHMRRHRASNMNGKNNMHSSNNTVSCSSGGGGSSSFDSSQKMKAGNKRVLVLDLDLNLTPFENDLEFLKIGKATANLIDYFH